MENLEGTTVVSGDFLKDRTMMGRERGFYRGNSRGSQRLAKRAWREAVKCAEIRQQILASIIRGGPAPHCDDVTLGTRQPGRLRTLSE